MPNRNRKYFQCPEPQCTCNDLEEVCRATQYSMISGFYCSNNPQSHNAGRYYTDYWDTETEGHDVIRVQCAECGFEVADHMPNDLYEYLLNKGWIQNEPMFEEATPAPQWEV